MLLWYTKTRKEIKRMNLRRVAPLILGVAIAFLIGVTPNPVSATVNANKKVATSKTKPVVQNQPKGKYVGLFSVSHYCPCAKCVGSKKQPRTATGTIPRPHHTISVDKNIIPLNSVIYVEGIGTFVAEDTGGAIKGHKLDIFVSSHQEALNLGTRGGKKFKVYIIK